MSDPPRRQVTWRPPRSAPAKPRRTAGAYLRSAGLAAAVLLGYLGWARWQPGPPRSEVRHASRQLTLERAPPPASARTLADLDEVGDVTERLDREDEGRSAEGEREREGAGAPDVALALHEPLDAGPPEQPPVALGSRAAEPSVPPHPRAPALHTLEAASEPGVDELVQPEAAEHGSEAPAIERRVELVALRRWQQPGLCPTDTQAARARELMIRRFRVMDWDTGAQLFLDPRLALGTHTSLLDQLESAENEVTHQLAITPPRPNVFAYLDTRLLLAASCANADVVAYYDGAVHVVPAHEDVAQSVLHEYTHHALASAGVAGPAWAHEGIAMLVARETWWSQREWLERVAERPFALDDMETVVPYTLSSEQATAFYVQAAAMVACAIHEEPGGLKALVQELAGGSRGGGVSYQLPPLADPRHFRACVRQLSR